MPLIILEVEEYFPSRIRVGLNFKRN